MATFAVRLSNTSPMQSENLHSCVKIDNQNPAETRTQSSTDRLPWKTRLLAQTHLISQQTNKQPTKQIRHLATNTKTRLPTLGTMLVVTLSQTNGTTNKTKLRNHFSFALFHAISCLCHHAPIVWSHVCCLCFVFSSIIRFCLIFLVHFFFPSFFLAHHRLQLCQLGVFVFLFHFLFGNLLAWRFR